MTDLRGGIADEERGLTERGGQMREALPYPAVEVADGRIVLCAREKAIAAGRPFSIRRRIESSAVSNVDAFGTLEEEEMIERREAKWLEREDNTEGW